MAPEHLPVDGDADVVVVGAGHNGLVCAAYLARAGRAVAVLEARHTEGGCASTVDALGARVNICNCDHLAVRSIPLVEELDLAGHGLRYLDLECSAIWSSWSGGAPMFLFHDVDRTLDALAVTHPAEVAGYRRYVADALPLARLVTELALRPPTPRAVLGRVVRRRAAGLATLLRWSRRSAAEVLRDYVASETILGGALAAGPSVWGVSPHQPGTGMGALRPALAHAVRTGRPVGGSGALTSALRAALEAAGGRVRTGSRVDRILVERGRVRGVRTTSGSEVLADTVIVACEPRRAILEWLGDAPAGVAPFVQDWRSRPVRDGYESKVDAVVSELPRYRGLDEALLGRVGLTPAEALEPTMMVAPTVDGIAEARADADRGSVAARPIMLANVPSVLDPSMRGARGEHVFSLEVLFTPYALGGGWPHSVEPRRWLDTYGQLVEPAFLDGVVDWRAMTPDRYEADFSLPRGYSPSFVGGPLAALMGRDPALSRYRTPLSGLYLTGAATFPGAGVWGAPGRNTARVVLDERDRRAA